MKMLENRVAVVTGATGGIGKAISLALAAQGATVCLVARSLEALRAIAKQTGTPPMFCYPADLCVDSDVQKLIAKLQEDVTSVDMLIHAAGVIWLGQIESAGVDQMDCQYRLNLRAPYILTQALLPGLKSRQGQILFVNSTAALTARPNAGAYAATKHGLRALADSLRDEVNPNGVRVMSLFLGRTATPMQERVHQFEHRSYHPELLMQPEDVAAAIINVLALPRTIEVTEIKMRPSVKSY
jgi:short-subunit dehydrogenase